MEYRPESDRGYGLKAEDKVGFMAGLNVLNHPVKTG